MIIEVTTQINIKTNNMITEEMTIKEMTIKEMTIKEMTIREMTIEEMIIGEMIIEEMMIKERIDKVQMIIGKFINSFSLFIFREKRPREYESKWDKNKGDSNF